MAQKEKVIQDRLREMIDAAISAGLITPQSIEAYMIDNGWEYDLPHRATLEKIMKQKHIEYVRGYWVRTR
jgi:hypothetical protein